MANDAPSGILVLDGDQFSTLAIVRSLGRRGLRVTVGTASGLPPAISNHSKYVAASLLYTDPMVDPSGFVSDLLAHVKQHHYEMVIPVTENTVLPLALHRLKFGPHCKLALPGDEALAAVINKDRTFAIAIEEGVPVPRGRLISTMDELKAYAAHQQFPVVIKPSRSVAELQGDVRTKLDVQYAYDFTDLMDKCKSILRYTPVVLQEYFRGDGVGVEIAACNGTIIAAFQHIRLHELPLTGGASTLRMSVPVSPQLLGHSERLIRRLNWHGVAMLEYKLDPLSNECRLMEINGRFWGSLPLAVSAGADFPYYLYQLLVTGDNSIKPRARIGHINRKLKDDLYWFLVVLFRRDKSPLVAWPSYSRLLADFISIFNPKHRFDSFSFDDPKPLFADIARTLSWGTGIFLQAIGKKYLRVKFGWQKRSSAPLATLATSKSVLFLCYGNINRSVLAESLLRRYLKDPSPVEVASAGFHPKGGRPADVAMQEVARSHGVDLSSSKSTVVDRPMAIAADIILVMEIAHYHQLAGLCPEVTHKVYLLGSTLREGSELPLEIADPFGQKPEDYQVCYRQIDLAVQAMAVALNAQN